MRPAPGEDGFTFGFLVGRTGHADVVPDRVEVVGALASSDAVAVLGVDVVLLVSPPGDTGVPC